LSETPAKPKKPRPKPKKTFWRQMRAPLRDSFFLKSVVAGAITNALRFVRLTNPLSPASMPIPYTADDTVIVALWHGQHLMVPTFNPKGTKIAALISRSADAEMNAMVIERFGHQVVRGSGGRGKPRHNVDKGGARALVALKKALDQGTSVVMIADIPHGTPREAGLGIITLAKISGRPIVPSAVATSRRKVIEKSWDKTTINLPFGRSALGFGPYIEVPANADDALMEEKRQALTDALNLATEEADRRLKGLAA
jgi:lysophospholipid acyltransferase (LPLAT)-like uncharacterized protein